MALLKPLAHVQLPQGCCELLPAAPTQLHAGVAWRADGNSPVLVEPRGTLVFFSDYEPMGHTLRRLGRLENLGLPEPVRFRNDPSPQVGKWIEAIWRASDGRLYGWFHAEERAKGSRLFVPCISEAVSDDDGLSWSLRGELFRSPADQIDTGFLNGFFAGGYGDLSVLPDRNGRHLYMGFTSFLADETLQGIVFARLPAPRPEDPRAGLEIWRDGRWQPAGPPPSPLWPIRRGWRHPDPDGFWGPALHFNRALDCFVMLLNRTANGSGNLVQEGTYVSTNQDLADPSGWSVPKKLVQGGAWYPQVIGESPGDGDTRAGAQARFFLGGFSAWAISFSRTDAVADDRPLILTKEDFPRLFGPGLRSPW